MNVSDLPATFSFSVNANWFPFRDVVGVEQLQKHTECAAQRPSFSSDRLLPVDGLDLGRRKEILGRYAIFDKFSKLSREIPIVELISYLALSHHSTQCTLNINNRIRPCTSA